jgi:hypothetical protein
MEVKPAETRELRPQTIYREHIGKAITEAENERELRELKEKLQNANKFLNNKPHEKKSNSPFSN